MMIEPKEFKIQAGEALEIKDSLLYCLPLTGRNILINLKGHTYCDFRWDSKLNMIYNVL